MFDAKNSVRNQLFCLLKSRVKYMEMVPFRKSGHTSLIPIHKFVCLNKSPICLLSITFFNSLHYIYSVQGMDHNVCSQRSWGFASCTFMTFPIQK